MYTQSVPPSCLSELGIAGQEDAVIDLGGDKAKAVVGRQRGVGSFYTKRSFNFRRSQIVRNHAGRVEAMPVLIAKT